jgi:hypothetical protein
MQVVKIEKDFAMKREKIGICFAILNWKNLYGFFLLKLFCFCYAKSGVKELTIVRQEIESFRMKVDYVIIKVD